MHAVEGILPNLPPDLVEDLARPAVGAVLALRVLGRPRLRQRNDGRLGHLTPRECGENEIKGVRISFGEDVYDVF